jgi:hypothetical protein
VQGVAWSADGANIACGGLVWWPEVPTVYMYSVQDKVRRMYVYIHVCMYVCLGVCMAYTLRVVMARSTRWVCV